MKAADSLFILGSNGILTEHVLTPQKATGVPEGDDAPIELSHKPELEWNLLRFGNFHVRASLIYLTSGNHSGLNIVLLMLRIVHL